MCLHSACDVESASTPSAPLHCHHTTAPRQSFPARALLCLGTEDLTELNLGGLFLGLRCSHVCCASCYQTLFVFRPDSSESSVCWWRSCRSLRGLWAKLCNARCSILSSDPGFRVCTLFVVCMGLLSWWSARSGFVFVR